MPENEITTTLQSDVVESHAADAAGVAGAEVPPTAEGQETALPPEEPAATAMDSPQEPSEGEEKRAISARKLAANRANAQHSTGPKTPEGMEKSKFNAVKHGLTARYFPALVQAGTAESEEFEAVRADLIDHYQPMGAIERMLVEKLAIEFMRYRRLVEREHHFCLSRPGYYLEIVNKLARYQTAINPQLFEVMQELERVQEKRKAREAKTHEAAGSSE